MPLFKVGENNKLGQIREKSFNLEKDIQDLTEKNLEEIFGYRFVSTEFQLNNLRVDTLAFDTETKAFVIIEYKKGQNFSVIDQGYAYLSLMLNNKADFILEYNENSDKRIKRDDVDWSQSRVVFISPQFSAYQKGAIEFKDLPIELWEVRKYENDMVLYSHLKPTQTSESIKTVSSKKTVIGEVSREVREWKVDDHFSPGWKESKALFETLREGLLGFDSRIEESPQKMYIGYKIGNKVVFSLKPRKSKVILILNRVRPKDLDDPKGKSVYVNKSFEYYNKHITKVGVKNSRDVGYALNLAKQVYESFTDNN